MAEICLDTLLCVVSTAAGPSIILPPGVAPTTPANGAMWSTSAGYFVRLNGVTKQMALLPLSRSNRVVTVAGAVTVTTSDDVITINKTVSTATVVNLPASPTSGDSYTILDGKGDANLYPWTVTPAAGLIMGQPTIVMDASFGSLALMYNGSAWSVL